MQYLRILLLPFSFIYGLVVQCRNFLYDQGYIKSRAFNLPVISIGNLAVGGAGKSPMAEYILRLLLSEYKVAVLSRGYKRTTRGFREVAESDSVAAVGDEPLQFKRKFGDKIRVAVCEKRVEGIEILQRNAQVVVLDDAFQHRAVRPGLNILIFDYTRLNDPLFLLPAGNLREPLSSISRADLLVVSKCPPVLSEEQKHKALQRLRPLGKHQVFFSCLEYGVMQAVLSRQAEPLTRIAKNTTVFLLTGIANPFPLRRELEKYTSRIQHHDYPDHHQFSPKNITKLVQAFSEVRGDKLILTTEKDMQRLSKPELLELLSGLEVYYLPISCRMLTPEDDARFTALIKDYVKRDLQHHRIH